MTFGFRHKSSLFARGVFWRALTLALRHCHQALIVVDDANIPTVQRFCQRLAVQNSVPYYQTRMDHGLFFLCVAGLHRVDARRPLFETLKAWRRYFLAGAMR